MDLVQKKNFVRVRAEYHLLCWVLLLMCMYVPKYCKYLKAGNVLIVSESSVNRLILDSKQVLHECLLDE